MFAPLCSLLAVFGVVCTPKTPCQELSSIDNFNLEQFMSEKWYAHYFRPSPFQPETQRFCVTAEYSPLDPVKDKESIVNGYLLGVYNVAQDINGSVYTSNDIDPLCAGQGIVPGDKMSELTVGQCNTPVIDVSGKSNYWVIAYDEDDGHALIASGQPTIPTSEGLCTYSDPFSGVWLLARTLNETLTKKYLDIAVSKGIDVSDLIDVDHENCSN